MATYTELLGKDLKQVDSQKEKYKTAEVEPQNTVTHLWSDLTHSFVAISV